jgi:hypothetical protein
MDPDNRSRLSPSRWRRDEDSVNPNPRHNLEIHESHADAVTDRNFVLTQIQRQITIIGER